ncbi:efflux RND transporter permease subunit [Aliiroseovarius crassostreae]|uniref:efflux RND transporter permease subunit n=1 Tax=Aliiroseovarius crassostreae TaxID=154981 RepID=UPI003C7ADC01
MERFNLSTWAIRNGAVVGYFLVALCVAGLVSYLQLGRSEDPNYTIKVANVVSLWPGASAADMRDKVADPVEKKLQTVPYFDRIETYATPGYLAMQVWVKDHTPSHEVPESFYQIRKKLLDMKGALPAGVQGPFVDDEFGDVDSILLSISGDGANYRDLEIVGEELRSALLLHDEISKGRLYGQQDQRIYVEYDDARLGTLGVLPEMILQALRDRALTHDAGTLDNGAQRLRIALPEPATTLDEIRAIPIAIEGRVLQLGDIATVRAGYDDTPALLVRHNAALSVILGVVMAPGENLTQLDQIVDNTLRQFPLPAGIRIDRVADQPKVVKHAIFEFMRAFAEALLIVLSVCFVVLGWRTGLIVTMIVPVVLAITFIAMKMMGIELHRVSLGALIISLGLLVDDAIIAIESMLKEMEGGADPETAAGAAWRSTAFPMLAGTIVTAIGFMPVGFAPSSTGEYMQSMFWVIAIALLASWVAAVVFTPWLGTKLLRNHGTGASSGMKARVGVWLMGLAKRIISWAVDHARLVICVILLLFGLAGYGFVTVQKQFFPISERVELFVQLRLPEGSSIQASSAVAEEVETFLQGDTDIAALSTYIGQGPPRFWLALNPALPNPAYAELVVQGVDLEARERLKTRLETAFAKGLAAGARSRVIRFSFGPPVGFPVQFRLSGEDPQQLRRIGHQIRAVMAEDPRLVDPHLNWNERSPTLSLRIDADRARLLGVGEAEIARRLSLAVQGQTAAVLHNGAHNIDVVLRAARAQRVDPATLSDLVIATRAGQPVPLSQVARIVVTHEDPIIWQRSRAMTLTVRADVKDGVQPPDASAAIWRELAAIRNSLPPGVRLEHGGAWEESMKANISIAKVFPIVLLLMLSVIMIQVRSTSRMVLVLLSAPLGMIGASFALNLFGAPFGFVALLGLLALSGMDIRSSLILVEKVDANLRSGMAPREAIINATLVRMRPVVLTAAAAVLAMIPLSHSLFWGPMALAIMGGLLLATFMTLLFLPALYAIWFRKEVKQTAQAVPA